MHTLPRYRSLLPCLLTIPLLTTLVALLLIAGPALAEDRPTIRFNVSPHGYPPFTIVNPDGSHQGIVWDVLELIAKRQGYTLKAMEIPRKRVDDFILQGRVDVTARAREWTEDAERFLFTDPLLAVQEVFFSLEETPFQFDGPDAIIGKTVITHLGYAYPRLEPYFMTGQATRFDVQQEVDMFNYLLADRGFDVAVADLWVGLWHIRENGWEDRIIHHETPLTSLGYRLMFNRDWAPFVERFNAELAEIKASGEMREILDRYR